MINFPIRLPEIDPVALAIGPLAIRWYSLAYIAGILFALFWLKKSNQKERYMSEAAYDNWITWAVLSVMIGGRLGYVFFYNFSYFRHHLIEILYIWQGGMSFHGGLLGSILGMFIFAKKYHINFLQLTDNLSIAAPVGLFFGRLANFMNMELYGRVSGSDFGIIFPNAGDLPRHPSQLYEATLEGLFLFTILAALNQFTKIKQFRGMISAIFITLYGCFRMIIENFREPDEQIGYIFQQITMGQLLSLPFIIFGLFLFFISYQSKFQK